MQRETTGCGGAAALQHSGFVGAGPCDWCGKVTGGWCHGCDTRHRLARSIRYWFFPIAIGFREEHHDWFSRLEFPIAIGFGDWFLFEEFPLILSWTIIHDNTNYHMIH